MVGFDDCLWVEVLEELILVFGGLLLLVVVLVELGVLVVCVLVEGVCCDIMSRSSFWCSL